MKFLKSIVVLVVLLFSGSAFGQVLDPGAESPLDGIYSKSIDTPHKKPVPYVQLREADIMWLKRVWREVDMRQKANHVFYFPIEPTQGRKNLMAVIMEAIQLERIHAYASTAADSITPDDTFKRQITYTDALTAFTTKTVIIEEDEWGDETFVPAFDTIPMEEVTRFRIKEEVFFDKQRSVMETRILGIAPVIPVKNEDGDIEGYTEAFWIYFPEARFVFAEAEVYNVTNDASKMTYEEVFWKRKFVSRMIKISNVYDRSIDMYKSPMDALLEAQAIEQMIFNKEHDLWSY